ncbi:MAG TPA: DNA polymerase Y family protein [Woeseiaceae bacterium]|nr:DNA polymerase Y family protein [Woeseiaceae bacterium]
MNARDSGIAVFENRQDNRRVLLANTRAEKLGVKPGLSVNAALALMPLLALLERNPEKEVRALERLAVWAGRFTSMVSIEAPDLLLLEIGGSLQLFGDVETLRHQVERGLAGQSFSPSVAIAPAALAAVWLARAGRQVCVEETKNLTGILGPLPLSCLEWPESVSESLRGMGICCIGDCLRLPRQGFARRFGAARLLQLDRALGRLPDPRKSYRAPERFCEEYELSEEQSDSELLLKVCRHLLSDLERFLITRQLEVRHVQFSFFHLRSAATHLTLGCMQAGRTTGQWFDLLAIRFERLTLPEPVIAIRLRSGAGQALQAVAGTLFQANAQQSAPITHLLDRLSARMGDDSVHGVTTVAEHRPQYAWNTAEITGSTTDSQLPPCASMNHWHAHQSPLLLADIRRTSSLLLRRPLWMLPEPLPLTAEPGGKPTYHGPLKLVNGPERLETGWWDGNGIARDYFVAINTKGVHLWIYRNRKRTRNKPTWYLHGIFG